MAGAGLVGLVLELSDAALDLFDDCDFAPAEGLGDLDDRLGGVAQRLEGAGAELAEHELDDDLVALGSEKGQKCSLSIQHPDARAPTRYLPPVKIGL